MAASVAASVVWLTVDVIITPTPGRASGLASILGDLLTVLGSGFLVVTGAFDCTDTGFAAALDEALFTDTSTAFGTDFVVDLFGDSSLARLGTATLVLLCDLAIVAFFTAGLTGAAGLALVAGIRVFAGFFIAFAMESTTNWGLCSCRATWSALEEPVVRDSQAARAMALVSIVAIIRIKRFKPL